MTDDEIRRILTTHDSWLNWALLTAVLTAGAFCGIALSAMLH